MYQTTYLYTCISEKKDLYIWVLEKHIFFRWIYWFLRHSCYLLQKPLSISTVKLMHATNMKFILIWFVHVIKIGSFIEQYMLFQYNQVSSLKTFSKWGNSLTSTKNTFLIFTFRGWGSQRLEELQYTRTKEITVLFLMSTGSTESNFYTYRARSPHGWKNHQAVTKASTFVFHCNAAIIFSSAQNQRNIQENELRIFKTYQEETGCQMV